MSIEDSGVKIKGLLRKEGRPNILVTGRPGVGKSTFIQHVKGAPSQIQGGQLRPVNKPALCSDRCEIGDKNADLVELPSFLDDRSEDEQTFDTVVLLQIAYWLDKMIMARTLEGKSGPYLAGILFLHSYRGDQTAMSDLERQLRLLQPQIGDKAVNSAMLVLSWDGGPNEAIRRRIVSAWKEKLHQSRELVKDLVRGGGAPAATDSSPQSVVKDLLSGNAAVTALMWDLVRKTPLRDTDVGKQCKRALKKRLERSLAATKAHNRQAGRGVLDGMKATVLGEIRSRAEKAMEAELRRWDNCNFPQECVCECRVLRVRKFVLSPPPELPGNDEVRYELEAPRFELQG